MAEQQDGAGGSTMPTSLKAVLDLVADQQIIIERLRAEQRALKIREGIYAAALQSIQAGPPVALARLARQALKAAAEVDDQLAVSGPSILADDPAGA